MARVEMREVREGEVPSGGGTAIQDDPDRPVFTANGPDDYVCVRCGNVLAASMHPAQMTKRVRVRCGRCSTVNVARYEEVEEDVAAPPGFGGPGSHRGGPGGRRGSGPGRG